MNIGSPDACIDGFEICFALVAYLDPVAFILLIVEESQFVLIARAAERTFQPRERPICPAKITLKYPSAGFIFQFGHQRFAAAYGAVSFEPGWAVEMLTERFGIGLHKRCKGLGGKKGEYLGAYSSRLGRFVE